LNDLFSNLSAQTKSHRLIGGFSFFCRVLTLRRSDYGVRNTLGGADQDGCPTLGSIARRGAPAWADIESSPRRCTTETHSVMTSGTKYGSPHVALSTSTETRERSSWAPSSWRRQALASASPVGLRRQLPYWSYSVVGYTPTGYPHAVASRAV